MELFCNFGPDAAPVQKRLRHLKKRRLVPLVPLWAPNAASASLEKKRTSVQGLVQNEPPLVPLWVPNAASESLEKKGRLLPFVSLILAPNTWSRHGFSQSNSSPKRASPGCTFAAKRRLRIPRKKRTSVAIGFAHLGPEHLVTPRLFPI